MKRMVILFSLMFLLLSGCLSTGNKGEEVFIDANYEVTDSTLQIKGQTNLIDGVVGVAMISSSNSLVPHQAPSATRKEFVVNQGSFQINYDIKGDPVGTVFDVTLQVFSITDKGDPSLIMQPPHVLERYGKNLMLIEGPQVVKIKSLEYGRQNYRMLEWKDTIKWDGKKVSSAN